MARFALDVVPSIGSYDLTSELDGKNYLLTFRWNGRDAAWYMDISREDATPIRNGIRLSLGALLGSDTQSEDMPLGKFFVYDLSGSGVDAGFHDLGVRVFLYYFDEAEASA